MLNRRGLIGASLAGPALVGARAAAAAEPPASGTGIQLTRPCVISTWDFGVPANQAAWAILSKGGRALDAVEAGARIPEQDLKNHSVGRAGYPDRDGHVSLDASIMDEQGNCGAVAALEHIAHPISVARAVMEKTPHVLLVGAGALQFAQEQGFPREELLTPESRAAWEAWKKDAKYAPKANSEVGDYGKTSFNALNFLDPNLSSPSSNRPHTASHLKARGGRTYGDRCGFQGWSSGKRLSVVFSDHLRDGPGQVPCNTGRNPGGEGSADAAGMG
jgi:hypothetical protein